MAQSEAPPTADPLRGLYCNRTLNLRRIQAIGYDMDYTLIHYRVDAWEERAYYYLKERLLEQDWPVDELTFRPELVMRGLVIDTELGNVVKANRFGYVRQSFHGTHPLSHVEQKSQYERVLVDLNERRWVFLNTLFSISEACMYMQLVDLLDEGTLKGSMGYEDLYRHVRNALNEAHLEGRLKAEIIERPEVFVERDAQMPLALLDQKAAGKKILLITNSEWAYAAPMLEYVFDPFLSDGLTWRDVFDVAIVGARKPDFFSVLMPTFEVVSEDGLLREHTGLLQEGHVYLGGNASLVEDSLGLSGEEILYVGDHMFTDVNISKNVRRWRTVLVIRELEDEIIAFKRFETQRAKLERLMDRKERLEDHFSQRRLAVQRERAEYGPSVETDVPVLEQEMKALRDELVELDAQIAPLARAATTLVNEHWGPLMRAGSDKSHLARQVERYADVYTSRVSNFLHHTPFVYLRSHRGSLPHDPGLPDVVEGGPVVSAPRSAAGS